MKTPDIVLVLVDQWNPRMLGFQGNTQVRTPALDRLAKESIVFDNAYTPCPVCMPARWSLATGLYPHNHQLWMNMTGVVCPPDKLTLYRELQNAGYTTAKIGKFHYYDPHEKPSEGTDNYFASVGLDTAIELPEPYAVPWETNEYTEHLKNKGLLETYLDDLCERFEKGDEAVIRSTPLSPEDHPDGYITNKALGYINDQSTGKPMFLCVSLPGPHSPFDAPGEYGSMFDPQEMELAPNVPERLFDKYDRAHLKRMQANYYGKLAMLDDSISSIIAALTKRGTWENTLLIFTADHGEYLASHNRMSKCGFHEESAGIPLLIRQPNKGIKSAHTPALVNLVDVYATILDAACTNLPENTFGKSMLPIVNGESASIHDAVFSEIGHKGSRNFMVRQGKYKWFNDNKEHLFDLEEDPWEQNDLIGDPELSDKVTEIKNKLLLFLMENQINLADSYKSLFTRVRGKMHPDEGLKDFLMRELKPLHFERGEQKTMLNNTFWGTP